MGVLNPQYRIKAYIFSDQIFYRLQVRKCWFFLNYWKTFHAAYSREDALTHLRYKMQIDEEAATKYMRIL